MPISCALAKAKLSRYVAELRQASTVEKVTTGIKAGFLSSPTTMMKAAGGNAAWNAIVELGIKPVAVATDYLLALGKSARGGFAVSPKELRTWASSLDADGLGAMVRGFAKGTGPTRIATHSALRELRRGRFGKAIQTFVSELSTQLDATAVANALEFDRVKYKSPVVQTLVDGAFAVQEAADRPYYFLSFNSSLYGQAKLMAIKEGTKGAALKQRTAHYFEHPSDEMLARAVEEAQWSTFKDQTWLSKKASALKQFAKREAETPVDPAASPREQAGQRARARTGAAGSYLLETTIPFTGVPSSIAAKVAQMSPLGLLSIMSSTSQEVLARRIATTGIGAGLVALGYELAEKGLITAGGPTNPAERADWEARGRQAWSVKVDDYWLDAKWLAPGFAPLFSGAALHRIRDNAPDAGALEVAGRASAESLKLLTEQTYLQSVNRLIDAAKDPERRGTALLTSQIPTPAIVNRAAGALDTHRRAPETIGERAASRVGGRAATPKAQGSFGDLPKRTAVERLSDVASPGPLRKSTETDVTRELDRLRVTVGKPGRTVRLMGESLKRTADEYRALVNDVGPQVERAIAQLITTEEYAAATDEERAKAIENLVTEIRHLANLKFKASREDEVRQAIQQRRASPPE